MRLGVVDPEHAVHLAHRLDPVRDGPEGPEAVGDRGRDRRRPVPPPARRRARWRRCGRPAAAARRARSSGLVAQHEPAAVTIVPAVGAPLDREPEVRARHRRHHRLHRGVVRVADPDRGGLGVPEQPRLVAVVLLERGVPVEVIGREVGEHADGRPEVRRVVELERAQLQRQPVRRVRRQRHVAERAADVSRGLGAEPGRRHRVGDERRGRGLAVGAGDADAAGAIPERQEPDIHLGVDRETGRARRGPSGGTSGGTPGATTTAAARAIRSRSCPPSCTVGAERGAAPRAHRSYAGPVPVSEA